MGCIGKRPTCRRGATRCELENSMRNVEILVLLHVTRTRMEQKNVKLNLPTRRSRLTGSIGDISKNTLSGDSSSLLR